MITSIYQISLKLDVMIGLVQQLMITSLLSQILSTLPKKSRKLRKGKRKLEITSNLVHFYDKIGTTYKTDFLNRGNTTCPAKVHLETKGRGSFSENKDRFIENSDFKTMSRNFEAISTSKHHYV